MELRLLRYFLAVVEEQNISRAAAKLQITQPTLSRQLHELEDELGTELFRRGARRIELTPEGMLFRERAGQIVELTDKAMAEMAGKDPGLTGTVTVGVLKDTGLLSLADHIAEFMKDHSGIHFEIMEGAVNELREKLDLGIVDCAILYAPFEHPGYEKLPFLRGALMDAAFAKQDPLARKLCVTADDLKDRVLIMPEDRHIRQKLEQFDIHNIHIITESGLAGMELAAKGTGIYFCPDFRQNEKAEFRPLEPEVRLDYCLVYKEKCALNAAAGSFVRFLKQKELL